MNTIWRNLVKQSIFLFAFGMMVTLSGGYAQEESKKTFSCQGTRNVGVPSYRCERSVTEIINGKKVTTSKACSVPRGACSKSSTQNVQFCLTKDECEKAKKKPAQFCESKRSAIVPQIPKSYSDLRKEVKACVKTWEQSCRDYRLPGERQPAGCVPTTSILADRPESIGPGFGIPCLNECPE